MFITVVVLLLTGKRTAKAMFDEEVYEYLRLVESGAALLE